MVNAVGLGAATQFFYRYYPDDNELRFQLTTALRWWFSKRRREGVDSLASAAIKQQLTERQNEYVLPPKGVSVNGSTKWMYGINLEKARADGLDIPETLPEEGEMILQV